MTIGSRVTDCSCGPCPLGQQVGFHFIPPPRASHCSPLPVARYLVVPAHEPPFEELVPIGWPAMESLLAPAPGFYTPCAGQSRRMKWIRGFILWCLKMRCSACDFPWHLLSSLPYLACLFRDSLVRFLAWCPAVPTPGFRCSRFGASFNPRFAFSS